MKKLSFINKVIFIINNVFALLLVLNFILPYIKPTSIATAPVVGLFTPALILANVLFVCYWILIGLKKQFFLSFLVLFIGYFIAPPIYKFSSKEKETAKKQLSILSYNVRKFNSKKWIDDNSIPNKITEFVTNENPDILNLQEYIETNAFSKNYPYKFNPNNTKRSKSGLAIFSKHPIINTGKIKSKRQVNRIIFADILKGNDTIRIYNVHLQSLGLAPQKEYLGHKNTNRVVKTLRGSFKLQEHQINAANNELPKFKGKYVIAGDMNNTPYSWAYKNLKGNLQDTFIEAGKGLGKTYNFKGFPLRIDYIFADQNFEVLQHKNYDVKYSDHYPIMATLSF